MEKSPHHHDQDSSRSSSSTDQEVDQPPDYVAAGRFYECVFCKRGFTTAQALGGHMNIHRKDRAKNRPTPLINSNQHQQINNYHAAPNRSYGHPVSGYVPQPNYYPSAAAAHDGQQVGNYPTYFPESTSAGAGYGGSEIYERIPQFGDDWRVSLSLQFGAAEREKAEEDKDDEVDLELRLGYNR